MTDAVDSPRRDARINTGLVMLAFVAALALRLPTLDRFTTPDEPKWVCRSVGFHLGLRSGDLEKTLQTGHPGVLTMWVGVPAMGAKLEGDWLQLCEGPSLADSMSGLTSRQGADLAERFFKARRGVAVLTALAMGMAAWLLVRLLGRRLALPAVVMLLGDPFLLAHSRLLHLDGIIASFALLSLLALAVALREDKARFLAVSGVCAGLAALNKSPAMVIAPFAALALCAATLGWRRPLSWLIRAGLIWIAAAAATYVLVWPAMWVRPWQTLSTVLGTATYYAETPHSNGNFFMGVIRADPGPVFYPVALAFRLTPWTSLGLLLALPLAWRRNARRPLMWLLGAFVLIYMVFMTAGAKKFDRYILPIFGPLDVIAAVGLSTALRWGLRRWRGISATWQASAALAALLGALAVGTVLPHAPYYLTYYNPLLGGARNAAKVLLVGWGEGLDEAIRYLNTLPDIENRRGVARALTAFVSNYSGEPHDTADYDPATTDYVVLYLNDVQRRLNPELMERYYDVAEPIHVARVRGIDYAWVYANTSYQPPMDYLAAHADLATDVIVVSRPSLFDEYYDGAVPLDVLPDGNDEAAVHEVLNRAAQSAERVWFVRYAEQMDPRRLDWLDFEWKTHAHLLSQQAFTDVTVSLWQTKGATAFAPASGGRRETAIRFGDTLELVAYTPNEPSAQWGRSVGINVEWRALRQPDGYYSLALYVVDEYGRIWGQGDRWIVDQIMLPTAFWQDGAAVLDRATVELAPGIPPGTYRLQAEVYDRLGHERLQAVVAGNDPVQRIDLGPLVVASSSFVPDPEDLFAEPRVTALLPELALLGWRVEPLAVRFDERLSVTLGWRATETMQDDYAAHLELLDAQDRSWAEATCAPAGDAYPTGRWQQGETLQFPCDLHVSAEAPAGTAHLVLTLVDHSGRAVNEPLTLAEIDLKGHRFDLPASAQVQEAILGKGIRLRGFTLAGDSVRPGEAVQLTLYWQRVGDIDKSYKVFTHLVDAANVMRGQQDNAPMNGHYPTDRWQPGEVVEDEYTIDVSPDTPEGDLRLLVGMYDPEGDMPRLPLFDNRGVRQPDDRLMLDVEITVLDRQAAGD